MYSSSISLSDSPSTTQTSSSIHSHLQVSPKICNTLLRAFLQLVRGEFIVLPTSSPDEFTVRLQSMAPEINDALRAIAADPTEGLMWGHSVIAKSSTLTTIVV
ncbi:unnamed protein product [Lactuca virosa]|uniref:Uncharacterized protein n=1 Tax=Lactuca virosa TaxID=75947 RepID=A0AAU9L931_9ASTR|nr:unnamed protein product [Lactuca virosa]